MFQRYVRNKQVVNPNLVHLADEGGEILDEKIARALGTDLGTSQSLRGLLSKISMTSVSTSYSGIDAPGTAVWNLLACAESEWGTMDAHPEHLFAIEWDTQCQKELQLHPGCAHCLFANLEEFLCPRLRHMLKDLVENGKLQSVLQPVILENPERAVSLCLGF